jgi:hypothetical protein
VPNGGIQPTLGGINLIDVETWADIEAAGEVNALGEAIQDGIESLMLKPYDVRYVRLRFAPSGK